MEENDMDESNTNLALFRFQINSKNMENQRMTPQQMAEWKAAYTKPWGVRTPLPKETREQPDIVVKYAFGEYGESFDTKDTFSASFWKPR